MHCLSSAHAVGDCNAMSGDEGGGWSVMAQWRAARRPSQSWGTFARVHQRAEARSRSARAVSAWRAQSKSTWKASSCGVPQFQLPQRTPGQTRQARGGRRGPPGGAWAGPGAHCGVGPAWVLGLFGAQTPSRGARWSAERHSLSRPSQVAKAPYCALLSAQPRPSRRWKGHPVARAAVRPAAPVRLGRGGEPPGLISPSGVFPSPPSCCSRR